MTKIVLVDFDDTLAVKEMSSNYIHNPFIFSKSINIPNSSGDSEFEYYYIHQSSLTALHLLSALNIQVLPLSQRIDYDGRDEYRKNQMYNMLDETSDSNRNFLKQSDGNQISVLARQKWQAEIESKRGLLLAVLEINNIDRNTDAAKSIILIDDGEKYLEKARMLGLATINSIRPANQYVLKRENKSDQLALEKDLSIQKLTDTNQRSHLSSLIFTNLFLRSYFSDPTKTLDDLILFIDANTTPISSPGISPSQNLSFKLSTLECLASFQADQFDLDPGKFVSLQKAALDYLSSKQAFTRYSPQSASFFNRKSNISLVTPELRQFVETKRAELVDLLKARMLKNKRDEISQLKSLIEQYSGPDQIKIKITDTAKEVFRILNECLDKNDLAAFEDNLAPFKKYLQMKGVLAETGSSTTIPSHAY